MISLDYDDTIMAAAGDQAEQCLADIRRDYAGKYLLCVEGNPPINEDGDYCIVGGRPFVDQLGDGRGRDGGGRRGSCASRGCVQAAEPNPTKATPIHEVIRDKPMIGARLPADRRGDDRRDQLHPHLRPTARAGPTGSPEDVLQPAHPRQVLPTAATSTSASSWRPGTTRVHARGTASTRWAAAGPPPTTPARRPAGTTG